MYVCMNMYICKLTLHYAPQGCADNYDPCRDTKTTAYLNDPTVKAAIHANASIVWSGLCFVVLGSWGKVILYYLAVGNYCTPALIPSYPGTNTLAPRH